MTGQVKEDILSRFGELGVEVEDGQLQFNPCLLRKEELLEVYGTFTYVDLQGIEHTIDLPAGSLCYSICQVPVIYLLGERPGIDVSKSDGTSIHLDSNRLDPEISRHIFGRTGEILRIDVCLDEAVLK
jgi:hypothetical protein